jgi:hypothetical protein
MNDLTEPTRRRRFVRRPVTRTSAVARKCGVALVVLGLVVPALGTPVQALGQTQFTHALGCTASARSTSSYATTEKLIGCPSGWSVAVRGRYCNSYGNCYFTSWATATTSRGAIVWDSNANLDFVGATHRITAPNGSSVYVAT